MSANQKKKTPIVCLQNVGLSFRQQNGINKLGYQALKNISLEIFRGETLGIIGRNGAGKSTLLRIIAGILKPQKGRFLRQDIHCALLTLRLGFIPYLSGRQNVVLSGLLQGLKRREIEARMESILEFSELGDFFDRPLNTYSSGMAARLGFSAAIQVDPDILLIDEVLAVGDAEFKKKSVRAMHEKIASNKTIVFVSHDHATVSKLCDRVVWIDQGVTKREGLPTPVVKAYLQSLPNATKGPGRK